MAQILQRRYSLPVVRVTVTAVDGEPRAEMCLVVNADGHQEIQSQRTFDLAAFGCGDDTGSGEPDLRVPDDVRAWVADWVAHLRDDSPLPPSALWLHFRPPHGALGAVPWERDLQRDLGVPLLRLPGQLPEPARSSSTFDVALVATAPAANQDVATAAAAAVARAMADGVGQRLRLHVFTEREAYDVMGRLSLQLPAREVVVHRARPLLPDVLPPKSASVPPATAPAIENPWLRWVRQAMSGRTLDAVHLVVHGYYLGYDGAVLTSAVTSSAEQKLPRTLQAGEVLGFANQVGALNLTFSRPPDNFSDYGLRQLVDELSGLRAGPVMLHDPREDPGLDALRDGYRFLSAGEPVPAPASPALTLCTQPHQVLRRHPEDVETPQGSLSLRSSPAVQEQFDRDQTPMWLAAAERYLEHWEGELVKFQSSQERRTPTPIEVSYYTGIETALHKIRDVVDRHAEQLP